MGIREASGSATISSTCAVSRPIRVRPTNGDFRSFPPRPDCSERRVALSTAPLNGLRPTVGSSEKGATRRGLDQIVVRAERPIYRIAAQRIASPAAARPRPPFAKLKAMMEAGQL
jgi:hypothetical protein